MGNEVGEKMSVDTKKRSLILASAGLIVAGKTMAGEWQGWPDNNDYNPRNSSGPASSGDGSNFWNQPRRITMRNNRNKETISEVYFANGAINIDGYKKICWFMRDWRQSQAIQMDLRMLDLLCAMQAWVSYYGYTKPFILTSGYRTLKTNQSLEGAAKNSMHMQGKASDIVIPDLPVSYIGRLAEQYAAGGVGFYPSSGFVHIDTGRVRTWGRK